MRKRFYTRSITFVLCLALLAALASCHVSYTTLHEITKGDITYTLEGAQDIPKRIAIKRGGYLIRLLDISSDASVKDTNGQYGFYVEDANFDGKNDILVATKKEGEICTYSVYLAENDGTDFTHSTLLSNLKNIRVRPEYQAVFGFEQTKTDHGNGNYTVCDRATKYVWENGILYPDVYAALTYYSEQNRYCYSTAAYDTATGTFDPSKDRWLTPEEYASTDFGFLYYYKEK